MPWTKLQPPSSYRSNVGGVITICGKQNGHIKAKMTVSIRTDRMSGVDWAKVGSKVDVSFGSGETAGLLRIEPSKTGPFGLYAIWPRPTTVSISLPWLPQSKPSNKKPEVVAHVVSERAIEITLPNWALASLSVEETLEVLAVTLDDYKATNVRPALAPFKGALSSTVDPMITKRQNYAKGR